MEYSFTVRMIKSIELDYLLLNGIEWINLTDNKTTLTDKLTVW